MDKLDSKNKYIFQKINIVLSIIDIVLILPQVLFTVLLLNVIFQIVYFPGSIDLLLHEFVMIILFEKLAKIIFFVLAVVSSTGLVVSFIRFKKVIFRIILILGLILNILIMLQIIIFFDSNYFMI